MSVNQSFNGVTYPIPSQGDLKWGPPMTRYLVALGSFALSPAGGLFTLTADINFGTSFGLLAPYFSSTTANIATLGNIRLAKTDTIDWRNNANSADLALALNGSDQLTFNGTPLATSSGGTVNAGTATHLSYYASNGTALSDASGHTISGTYTLSGTATITQLFIGAGNLILPSGNEIEFRTADNAASMFLKAPATGSSYPLLLPPSQGGSSSLLQNDGAGNLSFSTNLTLSGLTMVSSKITGVSPATLTGDVLVYNQSGAALTSPVLTTPSLGVATATSIAFSSTSGILGTTTNDNAAAGSVGQYVESVISAAANFPASGTYNDLTSITLSAGDWDVSFIAVADRATATQVQFTDVRVGISQTPGNSSTGLVFGSNFVEYADGATGIGTMPMQIAVYRQSLSGTTIIYGKMQATYSGGQPTLVGRLSARRVR